MKILFPYNSYAGGFLETIKEVFKKQGFEVNTIEKFNPKLLNKIQRRVPILGFDENGYKNYLLEYNKHVISSFQKFKPKYFFNFSGSNLFPATVAYIRHELNCISILLLADNPFDSSPHRDPFLAMTLKNYDFILSPEYYWDNLVRDVSIDPKIIRFAGGYDPKSFYPVAKEDYSKEEIEKLNCDLSFTGGGYGKSPEGSYRSVILSLLIENGFNVKIWGNNNWRYRFGFLPNLEKSFMGERLSLEHLRLLFQTSSIYLNLPSPQVISSFQPRVFEIAASKGFQLIRYSKNLAEICGFDDMMFKDFKDLNSKVEYFLSDEKARRDIVDLLSVILNKYTWEAEIIQVLNKMRII